MQLIQILLPVCDNQGRRFARGRYQRVKAILSDRFSGLTAYNRSAAEGLWRVGKSVQRDDIIVYEVMAHAFNRRWWGKFKRDLETLFQQDSIVIRSQTIVVL